MPSISRLSSRAQAVARIQERSFPDDADDLVGVELEWLVRSRDATLPAEVDHRRLGDLVPPGGSALTIEPGGQVELSSLLRSSVAALCADVVGDVSDLGDEVSAYCAVCDLLQPDEAAVGEVFTAVTTAGIDIDGLAAMLQDQGAKAFAASWSALLTCIATKVNAPETASS